MITMMHDLYDAHLPKPYRTRLDDAEITWERTWDDEAEASGTHPAAVAATQSDTFVLRLRGGLLIAYCDNMVNTGAGKRTGADGDERGRKDILIGLRGVGWGICELFVAACLMCA
jgi:hypothetical protein